MLYARRLHRPVLSISCVILFVFVVIFALMELVFASLKYKNKEEIFTHLPPRATLDRAHNFRQLNRIITEYDTDVSTSLARLIKLRATADNPDLIKLIRLMMDPPSTYMVKMSRQLFSTPQSREVDKILNRKVVLFFVHYISHAHTHTNVLCCTKITT